MIFRKRNSALLLVFLGVLAWIVLALAYPAGDAGGLAKRASRSMRGSTRRYATSKAVFEGVRVIIYRPRQSSAREGGISENGRTDYFSSWEGPSGRWRVDFSFDKAKLMVNKKCLGKIEKGDKLEFYENQVLVNGEERSPLPQP